MCSNGIAQTSSHSVVSLTRNHKKSCVFFIVVPVECGRRTGCGGLWDGLVDAGAEAAANGNVTGGVVGLSALVPQLLLSPPLCSSI